MKNLISMACLTVLTLSACTTYTEVGMARLSATPVVSGGSYTSGGGLTVAADLREYEGMTMACGVWAQSRRQSILTKHVESKVLSSGAIYLGNDRVIQDFTFMNEVEPTGEYGGLEASCVKTERPWQAGDERKSAKIRIPRQVVVQEVDGDIDGGGGLGDRVLLELQGQAVLVADRQDSQRRVAPERQVDPGLGQLVLDRLDDALQRGQCRAVGRLLDDQLLDALDAGQDAALTAQAARNAHDAEL